MPRDQFIVEVWEAMNKDVVGASELSVIQESIVERFGTSVSPASIARVLADHGARLGHPEILQADARWRERKLLFTAEDLELTNLEAAIKLVEKIELLSEQFEADRTSHENLRQAVRALKTELDAISSKKPLAAELAQWLTVWLQTPHLFAEWLSLRQNTAEFRERFLR